MLNIVADENIIFAKECFSQAGNVRLLPGREIKNKDLKNADALIVRSVTQVNRQLLENTNVKFVGTATIGEDHIQKEYLLQKGIGYSNAKGCNSQAVAEYFFAALSFLLKEENISLSGKTIGIIGVGNIGSKIAFISEALGLQVIKNDPPLERTLGGKDFHSLEEALSADIITFHVPLNIGGIDNTYHLLNRENAKKVNSNAILVNTSRGSVIETVALKNLTRSTQIKIVLDVWENEPDIDLELLNLTKLATPHIAGYSYEGKLNGTLIVFNALRNYFNIKAEWIPPKITLKDAVIKLNANDSIEESLVKIFSKNYSVKQDDANLRKITTLPVNQRGIYFDSLRKNYPLRYELKNFSLTGKFSPPIKKLSSLLGLN